MSNDPECPHGCPSHPIRIVGNRYHCAVCGEEFVWLPSPHQGTRPTDA